MVLGPQIGIGGHRQGALAGALRQIPLGQHLQAPLDPADQVHFVFCAGWLAKGLLLSSLAAQRLGIGNFDERQFGVAESQIPNWLAGARAFRFTAHATWRARQ
ncbi:MAG TPA: hypothetical protein VN736_22955 [Candidatus Limnocylindrales bacterium]|nr:hypothetical protein [Candidatus Limnocylindrales bacterium]